ncbi:hypothetical protein BD560DRAFT_470667 [Blakeslea trispora]|nr:hypothetical protein BD560DRAFT_470667 [Blakeslea trispora]
MWSTSLSIVTGCCPSFLDYSFSLIYRRLEYLVSSHVAISLPHLQEMLFIRLFFFHYYDYFDLTVLPNELLFINCLLLTVALTVGWTHEVPNHNQRTQHAHDKVHVDLVLSVAHDLACCSKTAVKKQNNFEKNHSRLRLYIFSSAATAKRLMCLLKALVMEIIPFLLPILLLMIPKGTYINANHANLFGYTRCSIPITKKDI